MFTYKKAMKTLCVCIGIMACVDMRAMQSLVENELNTEGSNVGRLSSNEGMALALETAPNRYSPITITELTQQDRKDARELGAAADKDERCLKSDGSYPQSRLKIAKAAMCNVKSPAFMAAAMDEQDSPLVEILLREGMDPNEHMEPGRKPLMAAKSVGLAKLLVQYGASMKGVQTEYGTLLHACAGRDDYSADLLEYYIQHAGVDINNKNFHNNDTPLHKLAQLEGHTIDFKNVQSKLALLIKADAVLNLMNANHETALDIIKKEREQCMGKISKWSGRITGCETLIAQLTAAIQAQSPAKAVGTSSSKTECYICLQDRPRDSFCTLACTHVFHEKCIEKCTKIRRRCKTICPSCRMQSLNK